VIQSATRMVRLASLLSVASCGHTLTAQTVSRNGSLFSARSRASGANAVIQTTASVTNISKTDVRLEIGADCPLLLRVYANSARSGIPKWDGLTKLCFDIGREYYLKPGERVVFERSDSARAILGDSLPFGRYYLSAVFRTPKGRVEVPSGRVKITSR
jgi:hypothetical protein